MIRNPLKHPVAQVRAGLGILVLLTLAACSPTGAEGGSGGGGIFDPNLPADTFVSETDPAKRDKIIADIWKVLASPACWDASFVGPATPSGTAANVSQFIFSGQYQYRYHGFETYAGYIGLQDAGTYRGKPAVLASTWSGEAEGFILVDGNRFEHVLANLAGAFYSVTFWTSQGPCL
jgi:hypothetical protein